jgi:hypothetical protein
MLSWGNGRNKSGENTGIGVMTSIKGILVLFIQSKQSNQSLFQNKIYSTIKSSSKSNSTSI